MHGGLVFNSSVSTIIAELLSVWRRHLRRDRPVVIVQAGVERAVGLRLSITHECMLRHRFRRLENCMLNSV